MQIQFDITLDDLIAFAQYQIECSSTAKIIYQITLIGVPLAFIISGVSVIFTATLLELLWIVAITFIITGIWLFVFPRLYRRQLDKMFDRATEKILTTKQYQKGLGQHIISMNEHGLQETTSLQEGYWPWSRVERIEQNGSHIFIFFSVNFVERAYVIPKRVFANKEQAIEFYNTAKNFLARG